MTGEHASTDATAATATRAVTVVISGATGRMGLESVKAVAAAPDLQLLGLVGHAHHLGADAGGLAGVPGLDLAVETHLANTLQTHRPQVLLDFSVPQAAYLHAETALAAGVRPVIGTTGLTESQREALRERSARTGLGVAIIPNFAIGAVLMMQMARLAARYFQYAEIIEYHHERKLDAPSGTALQTAARMLEVRPGFNPGLAGEPGARGLERGGLRVHSVRLPGLLAHQEVVFGELGQTLSIRHDTISRECYMPGVLLALRAMAGRSDFVIGLEQLLEAAPAGR